MDSIKMTSPTNITLIVCTKDRPKDLTNLLSSISIQSHQPSLIIIVDGSDTPVEYVLNNFPQLKFDYIAVRPPSLLK